MPERLLFNCGGIGSIRPSPLLMSGALTQLLERLLYGVEPLDPWTFGVTSLVLLIVATFASYVPARRGMHIAPVDALRTK